MNAYQVAKRIEKHLKEKYPWSTEEGMTPPFTKGKQATYEHGYFNAEASIVWEEGSWVEELVEKYTIPWVMSEDIRNIAYEHGVWVEPYSSWFLGVYRQ